MTAISADLKNRSRSTEIGGHTLPKQPVTPYRNQRSRWAEIRNESIDTTTAGGKLIFNIFGALAEFERTLIKERTVAGLAAARARGRRGGRPLKMSKGDVKKAAAMLLSPAMTKAEVARHFGVSRVTLDAALARDQAI